MGKIWIILLKGNIGKTYGFSVKYREKHTSCTQLPNQKRSIIVLFYGFICIPDGTCFSRNSFFFPYFSFKMSHTTHNSEKTPGWIYKEEKHISGICIDGQSVHRFFSTGNHRKRWIECHLIFSFFYCFYFSV